MVVSQWNKFACKASSTAITSYDAQSHLTIKPRLPLPPWRYFQPCTSQDDCHQTNIKDSYIFNRLLVQQTGPTQQYINPFHSCVCENLYQLYHNCCNILAGGLLSDLPTKKLISTQFITFSSTPIHMHPTYQEHQILAPTLISWCLSTHITKLSIRPFKCQ